MSGLHRPVAIDTDYANFADLSLTLRCLPGPFLDRSQAQTLCRKLAQLFENQGAKVETTTSSGRPSESEDELADTTQGGPTTATKTTALYVELGARLLHEEVTHLHLWWSIVTDYTFAQDISIRDETGFLLIRDTLTGRFIRRFGFFDDTEEEFSRDYYRQLSQLALNAKVRRQVLNEDQPKPAAN